MSFRVNLFFHGRQRFCTRSLTYRHSATIPSQLALLPQDIATCVRREYARHRWHGWLRVLSSSALILYVGSSSTIYASSADDTETSAFQDKFWDIVESCFKTDRTPLMPAQTLVKVMWTRTHGYRLRKRPGVDALVKGAFMAGYELVIWDSEQGTEDAELQHLELDQNFIQYHFFRDHTNFRRGRFVKDMSRLNRDMRRVVVVDSDKNGLLPQENAIDISPFLQDPTDQELFKILKFLEQISQYNVHDVRDKIKAYNANPNGDHFVEEESLAWEAQRELNGGKAPQRNKGQGSASKGLGGWFGGKKA
eukprot:g73632.t1